MQRIGTLVQLDPESLCQRDVNQKPSTPKGRAEIRLCLAGRPSERAVVYSLRLDIIKARRTSQEAAMCTVNTLQQQTGCRQKGPYNGVKKVLVIIRYMQEASIASIFGRVRQEYARVSC
jgi:hypothetical protein